LSVELFIRPSTTSSISRPRAKARAFISRFAFSSEDDLNYLSAALFKKRAVIF
jgi:hypothetical protein